MGAPPSLLRSLLALDPPLDQGADYLFDPIDRAYIDDQFRSAQGFMLQALLTGAHCSFRRLDPSSKAAMKGDVVCAAGSTGVTVTRAIASALAAGGVVLGVVILGAAPGGNVLVAFEGLIPAEIVGLTPGAALYASVNTSTGRVQTSASPSSNAIGTVDPAGNLTLRPVQSVILGASPSGLALSIVDIATGAGAAGLNKTAFTANLAYTAGVGFGVTQAGHVCTGARLYWGGASAGLTVSVWNQAGSRLATATILNPPVGVMAIPFASPLALVPGTKYAITVVDDSPGPPNGVSPFTWFYNGATSGTAPMGSFLPSTEPSGNGTTQLGPFVVAVNFFGSSTPNDIFGLVTSVGGDSVPTQGSTQWIPIEPMVA